MILFNDCIIWKLLVKIPLSIALRSVGSHQYCYSSEFRLWGAYQRLGFIKYSLTVNTHKEICLVKESIKLKNSAMLVLP